MRLLGQLFSEDLKAGSWKSIWPAGVCFSGPKNLRWGRVSRFRPPWLCECGMESGSDWSFVISSELVHDNCGVAIFSKTRAEEDNLPVVAFFLSQFELLFLNLLRKLPTSA